MKRAHRPTFSIKQVVNGFRFHIQFDDAQTLKTMLEDLVMEAPFKRCSTSVKCVDACIADIFLKLNTATLRVQKEFCFTLTHAQAFALHHALTREIQTSTAIENVVQSTILLQLDKLVA